MFGARAQSLARYLTKGTKVTIEGKLRWSQWEREGQKRSKIEVIVDEIEFMSSRSNGGAQSRPSEYGASSYDATPMPTQAPMRTVPPAPIVDTSSSIYDDDIPF